MPPTPKLLFFGEAGSGKTSIMGDSIDDPRLYPRFLIDIEAGSMAISSKVREITFDDLYKWAGFNDDTSKYDSTIACYDPKPGTVDVLTADASDLEDIFQILKLGFLPYKLLCGDSITEVNYKSLDNVTRKNFKKTQKGDGIMPIIGDYGDNGALMRRIIRQFRDLKIPLILSGHSQAKANEATGKIETKVALTGQLATDIPGMMTGAAYIYADENPQERIVTFLQTSKIKAKDRSENGLLSSQDFVWKKGENLLTDIFNRLGIE